MNPAQTQNLSLALQFSILLLQHAAELNQAILAAHETGQPISPDVLAAFRERAVSAVDLLAAAKPADADADLRASGG